MLDLVLNEDLNEDLNEGKLKQLLFYFNVLVNMVALLITMSFFICRSGVGLMLSPIASVTETFAMGPQN